MILFKKAARSIWRGKRSYIACVVLMAVGIMMFCAFNMLYRNLGAARDSMYADQRFGDVFAKVKEMPVNDAVALGSIEGVEAVEARLQTDVRVMLPGKENKNITLRVASFDPLEQEPLNAFLVTRGTAASTGEILIGQPFFLANSLAAGQELEMIAAGKRFRSTVSGAALSPEYVYILKDASEMLPDNEAFGYAYMRYSELAVITGKSGFVTDISLSLKPGVSFESLKPQLEDALRGYGLIYLVPRKDQTSNSMLNMEINSMGSMATSIPMVFVAMAVIILYIMLKRVIEQERTSIGTLKALGYSDGEVVFHYMCYGLLIGGVGGVLGGVLGLMLSGVFTDMYLEYFNLPALTASPDPVFLAIGLAMAAVSGSLGAYMGTRSILKLKPSEAMRPPAPRVVTRDVLDHLAFLRHILAQHGVMAVRNIARNKFRSAFVVCGVAFSFALLGFMASYGDMFDKLLLDQFTKVQLYDIKVALKEPRSHSRALEDILGAPGVTTAEGILEIPAELRLAHLKESVSITAMERDSRLQKIYDNVLLRNLTPPEGGLILSKSLADKLEAKTGDVIHMKTAYSGGDETAVPVLGIVNENLGTTAYCEIDSFCEMIGVPKLASSLLLSAGDSGAVKAELLDAGNVAAVTDKEEAKKVIDDMLSSYASMIYIMQVSGVGVAFAIIMNTASVALSERKREYATMMVLGLTPREITRILGFEFWALTIIGFAPGIPLVRMLKLGMAGLVESDMFSMPVETPMYCFVLAGAGCLAAVLACNLLSQRQISRFDMVEVLKERE